MTDERFDARAATYDEPHRIARAQMVAAHLTAEVEFAPPVRLLEYGAGTGLVSEQLAGTVGTITLVDRSQGMLDVLRAKVDEGRFGGARVWDFDLSRGDTTAETFDRIVSAMVLHHIPEIEPVLHGLPGLLAPGGIACLVDLDHDPDGSFHTDRASFDGHDGFERDKLRAQLIEAGFTDVRFASAGGVDKAGRHYPLFLAIARVEPPPTP